MFVLGLGRPAGASESAPSQATERKKMSQSLESSVIGVGGTCWGLAAFHGSATRTCFSWQHPEREHDKRHYVWSVLAPELSHLLTYFPSFLASRMYYLASYCWW